MTIQPISTKNIPESEPVKRTDPWAILAVLSFVRNTLAKGQKSMAQTTEKLIENGNKIQDKQLRDMKEMGKINLEALKKEVEAQFGRKIALYFIVAAIVIGLPGAGSVLTGSLASAFVVAKPLIIFALSTTAAIIQIDSERVRIGAANKQMEVAEIQEHVSVDAGLTDSNLSMISFSGNTLRDASQARVKTQKSITEIINSTGSAMQTAAR